MVKLTVLVHHIKLNIQISGFVCVHACVKVTNMLLFCGVYHF